MEEDGQITSIVRALAGAGASTEMIIAAVAAAEAPLRAELSRLREARSQANVATAERMRRYRARQKTVTVTRYGPPETIEEAVTRYGNRYRNGENSAVKSVASEDNGYRNGDSNGDAGHHKTSMKDSLDLFESPSSEGESPRARESGGDQEKPQPKKRATRIPENFEPDLGVAQEIGLSFDEATMEAASFIDYWRAKPSEATKLDWPATWRIWCRKSWKDRRKHDGTNRVNGSGYHPNGANGNGAPTYFDADGNRLTGVAASMAGALDQIHRQRERKDDFDARH